MLTGCSTLSSSSASLPSFAGAFTSCLRCLSSSCILKSFCSFRIIEGPQIRPREEQVCTRRKSVSDPLLPGSFRSGKPPQRYRGRREEERGGTNRGIPHPKPISAKQSKLTGKRIWRMDGDRIIQSKDILAVINKLYDENTRGDALKGRALALNPDVKNSLR